MRAAAFFDGARWGDRVVDVVDGAVRVIPDASPEGLPRLDGVVSGGFTDAHVHLQLVDAAALADSTLGLVVDLGGEPGAVRAIAESLGAAAGAPGAAGAAVAAVGAADAAAAAAAAVGPAWREENAASGPASATFSSFHREAGGAPRDAPAARTPGQEENAGSGASDATISSFRERGPTTGTGPRVAYAGAFLTPPGGYPSDRAWAPPGSVREIGDADAAARAVAEMKAAGATLIKVASNSTAGPVFTDAMFTTIVEIAASHGLSVIAHTEGPGEAMRATHLRAHMLAHAPFSERLTDEDLYSMGGGVAWVSTLSIHEGEAYEIAVDNVRRFRAIGGNVLYGTDMGNGETPVGLNPREIAALREAGVVGDDLLRALAPLPTARLLFSPGATPETADPLQARLLTPADLADA